MLSVVYTKEGTLKLMDSAYVPKELIDNVLFSGGYNQAHVAYAQYMDEIGKLLDSVHARLAVDSGLYQVACRTARFDYHVTNDTITVVVEYYRAPLFNPRYCVLTRSANIDIQEIHKEALGLVSMNFEDSIYNLDQECPL